MPFLYVETARERICGGSRTGLCNNTLIPSALRADIENSGASTRTVRVLFSAQSTDALIYVTVVVAFYVAIFLVLLGSNLRRMRQNRNADESSAAENGALPKKQLVVHFDETADMYHTMPASSNRPQNADSDSEVMVV